MASLIIDKAKGIDRRSSDIDIEPSFATQLKNFSLTKRPQAWAKTGTYADIATTLFGEALPASITWLNAHEITLTRPDDDDLILLHGKDASDKHHLWVNKKFNGSTFDTETVKLTEVEGRLTADSGTNASQIVDSELSSSEDDYYNGWYVYCNLLGAANVSAIVQDYDGDTKTLTFLTGALNNATTGTTYFISRSPIGTIGSSAANPGGIAAPQDKIRFLARENTAIGLVGNESSFPVTYGLWYGYINRQFGITGTGSPKTFNNMFLDVYQPMKPYIDDSPASGVESMIVGTLLSGVGSLTDGDWEIYAAFIYDGYQIGPLSEDSFTVTTAGGNDGILVTIKIPYEASFDTDSYITYDTGDVPTAYNYHIISRRITGIRIYAKKPGDADAKFVNTVSAGYTSTDGQIILSDSDGTAVQAVLQADGFLEATIGFLTDPSGNTHLQDVVQTNTRPNFKYGVALDSHFIVAGIKTEDGEQANNYLISSVIDGDGVATPDNFGASNIINLGFFGAKQITGIKVVGDTATTVSPKRRLAVFTDDDYYILTLTTGASFDFALDKVGEREGCVAPDSLVSAEGLIFGISRNGFRAYTETGSRIIGEGLKTDFDALTDPAECVGAYYKKERFVLFAFPTDEKYYAVNLLSENFDMFELSFAHVMTILLGSRTGELYSMSTSNIYLHGSGNTQAGTAITPQWKSKRVTARDFFDDKTGFRGSVDGDVLPNEGFIRYRSDTAITLNAYRNGGSAVTFPNLSLPAQATMQSKRFKFPLGLHCKDIDLEVTLSAAQAASNTYFEWDLLKVVGEIKRRID